MTQPEFISLLKAPVTLESSHCSDLKDMCALYPYFSTAQFLYSKSLLQAEDVNFSSNLKLVALHAVNKSWFYYFLYPERMLSNEKYRRGSSKKSSGDYFEMIDDIERGESDSKGTLKKLAEKLKAARNFVQNPSYELLPEKVFVKDTIENPTPNVEVVITVDSDNKSTEILPIPVLELASLQVISEEEAKKLIKERKYLEAVEILRKLNLNNPKKSAYFADQIRFLEKVIANSKK